MNKRRELKGKSRRSKREGVALVVVKVKSKKNMPKFQKKSTRIFNENFFVMKLRKQEVGENTVSFLKKKETAKTDTVQKNVVFEMTGRYVKRENKGQNKDNQIKENLQKRDTFKKRTIKKKKRGKNIYSRKRENENVQKQRRLNTNWNFFLCQRQRGRTNMQNNLQNCLNVQQFF